MGNTGKILIIVLNYKSSFACPVVKPVLTLPGLITIQASHTL